MDLNQFSLSVLLFTTMELWISGDETLAHSRFALVVACALLAVIYPEKCINVL